MATADVASDGSSTEVAPMTIHDLTDDLLLHVMAHARFPVLVCLKAVSRGYRKHACYTLATTEWIRARLASRESRAEQYRRFGDFVWLDDVPTVEAMLVLKLVSATAVFGEQRLGHCALHLADSRNMVDLLMEHNADVNARRKNGRTALMDACERGAADVIQALCEHGADVHLKDVLGGVGAQFILDSAARCNYRDCTTKWPFRMRRGGHDSAVEDFESSARVLREHGAYSRACISREELWHVSVESPDEVPDEYVAAYH